MTAFLYNFTMKQYIFSPQHGFIYEWSKEKWSRFIGIVFHVTCLEDVRACLDKIESRYSDASHACYGYKIWSTEKSSDAGEPAGTAGKPILYAIQQSGYDNVLVIVVRYFGGTLLGAGWLVRAYGDCARKVLQQAPVVKQEVLQKVLLIYDYDSIAIVMQYVDTFEARIISQDTGILLQMVCEINAWLVSDFIDSIIRVSGAKVQVRVG